jgi:hypothetical protein
MAVERQGFRGSNGLQGILLASGVSPHACLPLAWPMRNQRKGEEAKLQGLGTVEAPPSAYS